MTTKKRNIRQPQQFEGSKVEGYFMISKQDALLAVSQKLTGSQLRLWIYLMAIDSFADYTSGGEIKYHDLPPLADIAVAIGGSLDRVDKDLRKLRKLGLYDYRTVTVQGHNLTAAKAKAEAERLSKAKSHSSSKPAQDKGSAKIGGTSAYFGGTSAYLGGTSAYFGGNETAKPLPNKDFSALQTYSDFLNTLSDNERENFLEFGKKKAAVLPKPPELPLKWIEANWEELRSQWEKTEPGRTAKNSQTDWTQHPDWENWLSSMRESVPRFVALGTCFDNKTRRAIADWALECNLVWGDES